VSDVISDRAWHNSEIASLMRPHWGRHYQFAIPIYSPTTPRTVSVWVFARSGRDFTAQSHQVAQLVRPVLTEVTRHHAAARRAEARPLGSTPALTDRERVVLRQLASGRTADQIGRRLDISPRTVQKHVEHLYRKLDVHDRRDAVDRARLLRILDAREVVVAPRRIAATPTVRI
jgi:DNA-binding CsgD family transcriptional regulator